MENFYVTIIFYVVSFLLMYVQIFFMVTFLERRGEIKKRRNKIDLSKYPSITVIVPCWNEDQTIEKTVESLLEIRYPKEQLKIFVIDDGSIDNTPKVFDKYKNNSQITLFTKENGGKHTALNLGLKNVNTEFVACLDADSSVHPEAVVRMMTYFEDDTVMAVVPVAIVGAPKTFIQKIQNIEYNMSAFIKQMLSLTSGMHVTPGTLPIYRKSVFDKIGGFRKAYNTEDGEIALRMHKNHMDIAYCADAYIYTVAPSSISKLYKQRLRWMYGFINNVIDYRSMLFNPKYNTLGLLSLPSGIISIFAVIFLFGIISSRIIHFFYNKAIEYSLVGHENVIRSFHFDWFFVNTKTIFFIAISMYLLSMISILIGTKIVSLKTKFSWHMISFMVVYSIIAPFWMLRAVYNVLISKSPDWR